MTAFSEGLAEPPVVDKKGLEEKGRPDMGKGISLMDRRPGQNITFWFQA